VFIGGSGLICLVADLSQTKLELFTLIYIRCDCVSEFYLFSDVQTSLSIQYGGSTFLGWDLPFKTTPMVVQDRKNTFARCINGILSIIRNWIRRGLRRVREQKIDPLLRIWDGKDPLYIQKLIKIKLLNIPPYVIGIS
jgi:hypothetical protein